MPVYRYKRTGLSIAKVKAQVPPADAASVSAGDIGPTQVWDITAPTTSLDDLDDYMASMGWEYDSTDPTSTPAEQSAGDQDHGELLGLGDDDHSQYHDNTRGDARYYQKTEWTNKAQLDLVTDGDHDVRTDNPHSVSAAQAGAAPSTHASQHQNGGADEVATATPAANAIPKADGSGTLDAWVTGGGQDAEDLIVTVLKDSVGTINPGQTVRVTGYNIGLNVPEVELADASASSTMPAFGIARTTITNAATGTVVVSGRLTGQDTSSWSVGDELYVNETAGALTGTKPTGTALVQKIAQVTRSNVSVGVLQIFGAGRSNDLPNIAQNNVWMGNASAVPTETAVSSLGSQIKLDDLAAPDDNTDLNATTSAHGLLLKLGGGTTNFLRADGSWAAPGGSGEINTASNVGTGGVGVFKQKSGVDLEFKKVNAGSSKITITDDTGNNEVDVDVVTGTDANSVCVGNDSRLSDSRTPTGTAGGDLGGTYPNPTVDDGADSTAIHDNVSGEINAITEKTTPVAADLLVIEDSAASNAKKKVQVGNLPGGGGDSYKEYLFQADQMESPNESGDWAEGTLAPVVADSLNNGLTVRRFDDTTDEGIGFTCKVPSGATNIIFEFLSRAQTAPASTKAVAMDLFVRGVRDNASVQAWSTKLVLNTISIPTNTYFQQDSETVALTAFTPDMQDDRMYQFCLERDANDANDTLVGDWCLHSVKVGFS